MARCSSLHRVHSPSATRPSYLHHPDVPSTFVHTLVTVDVPGPSPYELVATTTGHYRLVDVTDVTPQVVRRGHERLSRQRAGAWSTLTRRA